MKRRILLVDDELAILLTLKAILEINGFDVKTAASAKEAISTMKSEEFHMVITDLRMESDTSGYDVIRAARRMKYDPAVALLTAYPSLGSSWQTEGADTMMVKPMNTTDLLRQIEALLVAHEDTKQKKAKVAMKAASPKATKSASRHAS